MRYLLIQICVALELLEPFSDMSYIRGAHFSLHLDGHYNEILLSASLSSPDFLSVSNHSLSKFQISSLRPPYPLIIKDIAYKPGIILMLSNDSLLVFDVANTAYPTIIQQYSEECIHKYTKIIASEYIVLVNDDGFALFSINYQYPNLICEFLTDISSLKVESGYIIVASKAYIRVYILEDIELGILKLDDWINASAFNLSQLNITDMYIENSYLFVLENSLGLVKLSTQPLMINYVFKAFGSKLAGFSGTITLDAKFDVDVLTGKILTRTLTNQCNFVGIDSEYIYCGDSSTLLIISRFLGMSKQYDTGEIQSLIVAYSMIFLAFPSFVELSAIELGPLYITGTLPNEVSLYIVNFTVTSISNSADTQYFTLSLEYSVKDVLFVFFISFSSLIIVLVLLGAYFKHRSSKAAELEAIVTASQRQASSNSVISLGSNVISERVLMPRGHEN